MGEPCPVCADAETRPIDPCPGDYEYGVEIAIRFRILRCRTCGSEFVAPRPSAAEIARIYPDDYYAYGHKPGRLEEALYGWRCRREARHLLGLVRRRPLHLFDVGVGDCRHLRAISRVGPFRFHGVEMNEGMATRARAEGFDVVPTSFEDFEVGDLAGRMDVVTMSHVIEHVVDPARVVVKARELLADGGILFGRTPDLEGVDRWLFGRYWGGYHFPRHLTLFRGGTLRRLLLAGGFRSVEIRQDLNRFQALSVQNLLVGRLRLPLSRRTGRTRLMPLLLALTAPGSLLEYAAGRADCSVFIART